MEQSREGEEINSGFLGWEKQQPALVFGGESCQAGGDDAEGSGESLSPCP